MPKRGQFITLEGIEGSGKSTQIRAIASYFRREKKKYIVLREPGGTKISEQIREILLAKKNSKMVAESELLLYLAARAQIVRETIEPSLKKGINVICDRFFDSTMAYQGYGLDMDKKEITRLIEYATGGLSPDLTILLDVPVSVGLKRAGNTDRIEARSSRYHNKVRRGFLDIAKKNKKRIKVIDGQSDKKSISEEIKGYLKK